MADHDYTPGRLLDFLREAPRQGLLNPAVARSRASAIEHLFAELNEQERCDLRCIDVERLAARMHKIQSSTIRPEVLALYKTRVQEALHDYFIWLEKPNDFASNGGHTLRREMRMFLSKPASDEEAKALEEIALASSERRRDMLSVPLREGVTVYITELPLDLTADEARRIAGVITALVPQTEGSDER